MDLFGAVTEGFMMAVEKLFIMIWTVLMPFLGGMEFGEKHKYTPLKAHFIITLSAIGAGGLFGHIEAETFISEASYYATVTKHILITWMIIAVGYGTGQKTFINKKPQRPII